jgi:hypothetical protein
MRFIDPISRTRSAGRRNMGGRNDRWMSDGPVERATTPFIQKLVYFLPPFALFMYCVVVMIDSIPDLYPPETIIVNGMAQRWEQRDKFSPRGVKGVIFLENHSAGYSIHEALGYGFADAVQNLRPGDDISMRVHEEAFSAGNNRVALIIDAIDNAQTQRNYELSVTGSVPNDNTLPIPILELRQGDDVKYSRLELTAQAEGRIRNWGIMGLAAFSFLFLATRLNAR